MPSRNYQLVSDFPGYRAREESTKLPPGHLVYPSKNVVTNTAGRVAKVKGYTLDGQGSTDSDNGIQGWYDFDTKNEVRRNLRSGFLTSAGNDGQVDFRYKDESVFPATATWVPILESLSNTRFSFTHFWDTTELMKLCLFVNGDGNVYEWNGAVSTIESTTANTIVLSGTLTAQQQGFYTTRNREVNVDGNLYTYTGVSGNTLTGVTPDPSDEQNGSMLFQSVVTNAISAMAPASFQSFKPDLIQKGVQNVVYYGQSDINGAGSSLVYMSKVDDFKDCTVTSPLRVVGEGMLYVLDAPPRAFVPQETGSLETTSMLIYAGKHYIYKEVRTLDSTLTKEQIQLKPLRTGRLQGALNHNAVTRVKNGVMYLGNDNVVNLLGQISNQYVPELDDISYSIVDDMLGYDFTDASVYYHRNFIYVSVPRSGIIRAYNMTDASRQYWEAPIEYPVGGFYVTEDGELGGHGYASSESYLLFSGTRFRSNPDDDGFPINAYAFFPPNAHMTHVTGSRVFFPNRAQTKMTEELFVDGYMSSNTTLGVGINYNLDGCVTTKTREISGNNDALTCPVAEGGSLGSAPFGTDILGDGLVAPSRPPYFNAIPTFDKIQYRFEQVFFWDEGIDTSWEIISFGTDSMPTSEDSTDIRF